jgi:hypothetical protein
MMWVRGAIAALVSGLMGGVINGAAVMGIAPDKFNFVEPGKLVQMVIFSAIVTGVLGVAMYLRQSPLPPSE